MKGVATIAYIEGCEEEFEDWLSWSKLCQQSKSIWPFDLKGDTLGQTYANSQKHYNHFPSNLALRPVIGACSPILSTTATWSWDAISTTAIERVISTSFILKIISGVSWLMIWKTAFWFPPLFCFLNICPCVATLIELEFDQVLWSFSQFLLLSQQKRFNLLNCIRFSSRVNRSINVS